MTRDLARPALVLLDEVGAGTDPTEGGALGRGHRGPLPPAGRDGGGDHPPRPDEGVRAVHAGRRVRVVRLRPADLRADLPPGPGRPGAQPRPGDGGAARPARRGRAGRAVPAGREGGAGRGAAQEAGDGPGRPRGREQALLAAERGELEDERRRQRGRRAGDGGAAAERGRVLPQGAGPAGRADGPAGRRRHPRGGAAPGGRAARSSAAAAGRARTQAIQAVREAEVRGHRGPAGPRRGRGARRPGCRRDAGKRPLAGGRRRGPASARRTRSSWR